MTLLGSLAAAAAVWVVIALFAASAWAAIAISSRLRPPVPEEAQYTVFTRPSAQPFWVHDSDWLDDVPADVLTDDEIARRFNRMRIEGVL